MIVSRVFLMLWIVIIPAFALDAQGTVVADDSLAASFEREIVPLLSNYCYSCHGGEVQKADLNLEEVREVGAIVADRDRWELVQYFIEDGDMPPAGHEPRPDPEEVKLISEWIPAALSQLDCSLVEPGRVTLRRLNRSEYNATVHDLLGVDFRPADDFPADDVGYGFDNIGDVLSIDPLLMEKYLDASEDIALRSIDTSGPTRGNLVYYDGRGLRNRGGERFEDDDQILTTNGALAREHPFPHSGRYTLRARVYGQQAGEEPVRMAFLLDGEAIEEFQVEATARDREFFEAIAQVPEGVHSFGVAFLNDYYNESAEEGRRDRNLVISRLEIIGPADPIEVVEVERLGDDAGGQPFGDDARILPSNGAIAFDHDFGGDGEYRIRVIAFGQQAGPDPARLAFQVDGKTVDVADVEAEELAPGSFEARVMVSTGSHQLGFAFLNDYYVSDEAVERLRGDRNLVIDRVEIVGPVSSYYEAVPEGHRRVITERALSGRFEEVARSSLRGLASRAYRRPATEVEVDRLIDLYRMVRVDGGTFEEGMQLALQAVLVSPNFLFRVEFGGTPDPDSSQQIRPLDDWELASRLSYFLWNSMPDDELFQIAFEGKLRDSAELERQALRMLADPKAARMVESFGGQWLQIRNLDAVSPDPGTFPSFDEELRAAMRRETELCLDAVIREDRSILDLLDADYTFLNRRLAEHYGIEGVEGDEFRRVALPADSPRGGILTQASLLTITSNPNRTSPVKRGKYILDQILGSPPPPPPPDVPVLAEGPELTGTLRERMEQHRSNPSCASCHKRMDPLGFGFENFDAIGRWRDLDGDDPIDPSGVLPDAGSFQGPVELKALLASDREAFARTLTETLMTYALGRGLEYYDRCAVDRIMERFSSDDYRFGRLVVGIVTSDPFRMRKIEGDGS